MRSLIVLLALSLAACDHDASPTLPDPKFAPSSELSLGSARPNNVYGCELIEFVRARPIVVGRRVDVDVKIQGIGFHGTLGRVVFWPNGRHREPRVLSDLFETGSDDDFPVELTVGHTYANAPSGEIVANVDYEMLNKCYDWRQERFVLGGLDEHGTCIEGEYIVLQCDRGVSVTLN